MDALDKNGKKLQIGDRVEVPAPNEFDDWNFSFNGRVDLIYEDEEDSTVMLLVIDADNDAFGIEAHRVELAEE